MPSQPSGTHPAQLTRFFLTRVEARRSPILDTTAPLVMPPYRVEHSVEMESDTGIVVTYSLFTDDFESMVVANRNAFYFSIDLTAEFSLGAEMPRDQVGAFVAAGGLIVIWPYLRQTIADLSQRMGFPPLLLPVLSVPLPIPQPECPAPVQ
jgi:hypothetical protein